MILDMKSERQSEVVLYACTCLHIKGNNFVGSMKGREEGYLVARSAIFCLADTLNCTTPRSFHTFVNTSKTGSDFFQILELLSLHPNGNSLKKTKVQ
jgi:hypothetical protein